MTTGQSEAFRAYIENSSLPIQAVNNGSEGLSIFRKMGVVMRMLFEVIAALIIFRPDCLYITTSRSRLGALKDLPVLFAARFAGVAVINHLHGNDFLSFRERLFSSERALLDAAYQSIAVSIVLADRMKAQYAPYTKKMKMVVVHNSVHPDCAAGRGGKEPVAGRALRILFLSNLMRSKGPLDLIEAVRLAEAGRPESRFELRLAGAYNDPALTDLEVRAALATTSAGAYLGVVQGKEKWKLLCWADIIALPTYYGPEALPLSLLEGIAAGCLVLTTRTGYIEEVLGEQARAVYVTAKDPHCIARTLLALDQDRRLIEEAASHNPGLAEERFSIGAYVTRIDEVIRGTAKCKSTREHR